MYEIGLPPPPLVIWVSRHLSLTSEYQTGERERERERENKLSLSVKIEIMSERGNRKREDKKRE